MFPPLPAVSATSDSGVQTSGAEESGAPTCPIAL